MNASEARKLRKGTGLSQADFGHAIGVSRETIGRMERGSEPVDRRTELAMRYISENAPMNLSTLPVIHQSVAAILEEATVRGTVSNDGASQLGICSKQWVEAGGSAAGSALLTSAQGTIGMLRSSSDQDAIRVRIYSELRQLKLAWRAVSEGSAKPFGKN